MKQPHPEPHDPDAPPLTTDDVLTFIASLRREEDLASQAEE